MRGISKIHQEKIGESCLLEMLGTPIVFIVLFEQIYCRCFQGHNERLELHIDATDLVKIIANFGPQMPLLFIYTSPEGAAKIRTVCRMDSPDGPMFDPTSAGTCSC